MKSATAVANGGQGELAKKTTEKLSYTNATALFPFLLVAAPPLLVLYLYYAIVHGGGSVAFLLQLWAKDGFIRTTASVAAPYLVGSRTAWKIIGCYAAFELILMRILPGKKKSGPPSPSGHVPVYTANGVQAYCVTLATFGVLTYLGVIDPGLVYDHLGEILGALNFSAVILCWLLYFKGKYMPSGSDASLSGNLIFDYYWGTELYPRVLGWDVKHFTNCRFAMMGWPLLLLCYAVKQHQLFGLSDSMAVSVGLQLIYISKFFMWEMGYMRSLDIMHDRAGWMIVWGVLVWLPVVYTCHSLYLVEHPQHLGVPLSAAIMLLGVLSIVINYWADNQREHFRDTNGNCKIWGKRPVQIAARYTTGDGKEKTSLLLASGWWGLSRHFHYVPELTAAWFWSVPALSSAILPYFYFIFLTILLFHRAVRDDIRCSVKYGKYWDEYCKLVPSKIVPYVF